MSTVSYTQLVRQNRNFRYFWGGQIVSQLGDWFSAITVQSLLLEYTHGSAGSISLFMIAAMLPGFLLGPYAGVLVDRLPRKTVMVGSDLARMGIALGFLAFRGPGTIWLAYLCVAGLSCFTAFFEPARISTLPNITNEEELVTANALSSVTWSILLTSGALVGGLVASKFGTDVAFVMNALSFAGSAILIGRMKVPPTRDAIKKGNGLAQMVDGFRYVRHHPELRGAITAKLGWGLAGGIQVLMPVIGKEIYPLPNDRHGQLSISFLFAAGGLGTALGPLLARRFTGREIPRIRWAIAYAFVMGGVFYVCMAAVPGLLDTLSGQDSVLAHAIRKQGVNVVGLAAMCLCLFLARFHGAVIWVFSTVLLQMLSEDR